MSLEYRKNYYKYGIELIETIKNSIKEDIVFGGGTG
jgi:hypothetical protein